MNALVRSFRLDKIIWPQILLFAGGILWASSLLQVVFQTTHGPIMGYWVLLTGWMGFALFQFAWYANLLALLGLLLMKKHPNRAMLLVVISALLSGQAFWFTTIPGEQVNMLVVGFGTGFWCWYVSMILITMGVIFGSGEDEEDEAP